jgi:biopolymer transport protein ExbD
MKFGAVALTVSLIAFGMTACSSEHHVKVIHLEIHSNKELVLDGKVVKSEKLKDELRSLTDNGSKICVTVTVAEPAKYDEVRALIRRVQESGISCVGGTGVDS